MAEANINDPASIERVYDRDRFERDAAWNARSDATVVRGLKILSPPDEDGGIVLDPASRHVAELNSEGDSVFIAAHKVEDVLGREANAYGGSVAPETEAGQGGDEYRTFIDQVVEAARTCPSTPPIGFGDERLKGFRGG